MSKIIIWGPCGSGKSTLANVLGMLLGIPPVHLDMLAHDLSWTRFPDEEIVRRIQEVLALDSWIIEGTYFKTAFQERMERADTILFLDLPTYVTVWRCLRRLFLREQYGVQQGQRHKVTWKFLVWILWRYPLKRRKMFLDILKTQYESKTLILRSQKEIDQWLLKVRLPQDPARQ